ncbi:MAG: hypothetical protein M5T61_07895 [Acidimicrobiia bacterium]|nr:hypothetical protein [Acidimicrobiia bacterium]
MPGQFARLPRVRMVCGGNSSWPAGAVVSIRLPACGTQTTSTAGVPRAASAATSSPQSVEPYWPMLSSLTIRLMAASTAPSAAKSCARAGRRPLLFALRVVSARPSIDDAARPTTVSTTRATTSALPSSPPLRIRLLTTFLIPVIIGREPLDRRTWEAPFGDQMPVHAVSCTVIV